MNTTTPEVLAGQTLRMMREAHGVSLRAFSAVVGVSPSHLSRVESGTRGATANLTQRICHALAELPAPAQRELRFEDEVTA